MAVRKPHLKEKEKKDERKGRDKEEGKERKEETESQTPQRKAIAFEQADDDTEASKKTELAEKQAITTRRIWGTRSSSTSKALYEIAATTQRVTKGPDEQHRPAERKSKHNVAQEACELLQQMKQLSLQMKQDLEQLQSTGASSSDQLRNQQEAMSLQIDKLRADKR